MNEKKTLHIYIYIFSVKNKRNNERLKSTTNTKIT